MLGGTPDGQKSATRRRGGLAAGFCTSGVTGAGREHPGARGG
jgi:hypothetical protein